MHDINIPTSYILYICNYKLFYSEICTFLSDLSVVGYLNTIFKYISITSKIKEIFIYL